eukprot:7378586-Prymnesium_polylepis.3
MVIRFWNIAGRCFPAASSHDIPHVSPQALCHASRPTRTAGGWPVRAHGRRKLYPVRLCLPTLSMSHSGQRSPSRLRTCAAADAPNALHNGRASRRPWFRVSERRTQGAVIGRKQSGFEGAAEVAGAVLHDGLDAREAAAPKVGRRIVLAGGRRVRWVGRARNLHGRWAGPPGCGEHVYVSDIKMDPRAPLPHLVQPKRDSVFAEGANGCE